MFRSFSILKKSAPKKEEEIEDSESIEAPSDSSYPGDEAMEPDVGEDSFENVDVPTYNLMSETDIANVHAIYVADLARHVVPPYAIRSRLPPHGDPLKDSFHPLTTKGQEMIRNDPDHYRDIGYGIGFREPPENYKVVHWKEHVFQVPEWCHDYDCDETCPKFKDRTGIKRLARRAKEYYDDFDLETELAKLATKYAERFGGQDAPRT